MSSVPASRRPSPLAGLARRRRSRTEGARRLPPVRGFLPLVFGLLLWELLLLGGESPFFPPPSEWARELARSHTLGSLAGDLSATLRTFATGLVIASAVGASVGIAIGFASIARRALGTTLEFLRALPPPVIVPIAVLALGQTEGMKVFAVSFAATWPVLLNAAAAASATSPLLLDVARTFRLSRAAQVRKFVLPSTIPSILLGMRVALPVALIVTILVEMLTSNAGIGAELTQAQRDYRSADAFGLLFVVGVFGYAVNVVFALVESAVMRRWPPSEGVG